MFCLIYWFLTFLFKLFIYFYPKNNLEHPHVEHRISTPNCYFKGKVNFILLYEVFNFLKLDFHGSF